MDSYRFGAGRYIQENNALDFCGEEIKRYGNKAYVIGGNTAIAVTENRLCSSFEKLHGKSFRISKRTKN